MMKFSAKPRRPQRLPPQLAQQRRFAHAAPRAPSASARGSARRPARRAATPSADAGKYQCWTNRKTTTQSLFPCPRNSQSTLSRRQLIKASPRIAFGIFATQTLAVRRLQIKKRETVKSRCDEKTSAPKDITVGLMPTVSVLVSSRSFALVSGAGTLGKLKRFDIQLAPRAIAPLRKQPLHARRRLPPSRDARQRHGSDRAARPRAPRWRGSS